MLKKYVLKKLIYRLAVFFSIACFFISCKELLPKPVNAADTTAGKKDSVAVVDTLPSFNSPSGLALDQAGNIYVADYGNNLIRKISAAGVVSTFAGSGTQGANDGTGNLASFNGPAAIAIDAAGNLYIADSGNNLIRKITAAGTVTTLAGGDTTAMANGTGASASFFGPMGIAVDISGNVFVADAGDNMIRMINPAALVSTLAANTANNTFFSNPTGVAVNAADNVFVANYLGNNILTVNAAGAVNTLAGTGQPGSTNGPDSAASFYFPNSIALDVPGNVYVADGVNNLIRKITPNVTVSTLAGSGAAGAIDSLGTAASFNSPSGLAVDAAGDVYVADTDNNLIRKITPAGMVTTIAGTGEPGAKNGKAFARRNTKALKILAGKKVNIFYRQRQRNFESTPTTPIKIINYKSDIYFRK
jgi:sugar lactone lactonase YvrE